MHVVDCLVSMCMCTYLGLIRGSLNFATSCEASYGSTYACIVEPFPLNDSCSTCTLDLYKIVESVAEFFLMGNVFFCKV